ncbi:hypothetical protein KEM48_008579 [Puccinia striiformis f. sp. tritici PST-130]|nr:hypothetical protein KEM48_008579 [Puccinia striiformis f. sp. tritici PST-130]
MLAVLVGGTGGVRISFAHPEHLTSSRVVEMSVLEGFPHFMCVTPELTDVGDIRVRNALKENSAHGATITKPRVGSKFGLDVFENVGVREPYTEYNTKFYVRAPCLYLPIPEFAWEKRKTFQWAGPAIFSICLSSRRGISGLAVFRKATGGTQVSIEIKGLKSKEADAFHVHETAVKNGDCSTTGEHFNPEESKRFVKAQSQIKLNVKLDLSGKGGRLNARGGGQEAGRNYLDKVIKISDIVGRSVVIHSASGARIGCGNISCRRK